MGKKLLLWALTLSLLCGALSGCQGNADAPGVAEPEPQATENPRNQDGIGEKELLVVSFGTSYNDTRRLSIGAIEDALETAFPEWSVRRAFTSQMILKRVRERDGVSMDSVPEALERAAKNGVKTLVVQPTHLMNGLEYQELADAIAGRAADFERVAIGKPLLSDESDFRRVAEALAAATAEYQDGETAVCFMGHGTEADSNAVYEKLQQVFAELGQDHCYVGTVEATPSVEDVLAAVRAGHDTKVVLSPLMIVAGDHATNDMAGDEPDSWKSVFEGAGYGVTCLLRGLGELGEIQTLFAEHAQAAMDAAQASETQTAPPQASETQAQASDAAQASGAALRYAEEFTMDDDGAGRVLVTIGGAERYLVVRDGAEVPEASEIPDGAAVLTLPLQSVYVAASSAMDFFSRLDALGAVRFSGTQLSDWSLAPVREAMEAGNILYAGKYSAPDMESLLAEGCALAIESTMIYHSPDIREQLQSLGVPVLVERSSYETSPLGRLEWIKLYGLLTGKEAEADAFFEAQSQAAERIRAGVTSGKTVAFFSVSPNGYVIVRNPSDYVATMIEWAGGRYAFADLAPDTDGASVNLQMEAFYAEARDADILIYNATVDGGMDTLEELSGKSELFADFKAVRNGDVWRTERNFFQETTAVGGVIADLHSIFSDAPDSLTYFRRLS